MDEIGTLFKIASLIAIVAWVAKRLRGGGADSETGANLSDDREVYEPTEEYEETEYDTDYPEGLPATELFERFEQGEGISASFRKTTDDFLNDVDLKFLLMWGVFNPMGPTIQTLCLATKDGFENQLLYFRMMNPFSQESLVVGATPPDTEHESLVRFLYQLFQINSDGEFEINQSLPTFIMAIGDGLEAHPWAMFWHVAHFAPQDLDKLCDVYRSYWGQPWDRTKAEVQGAVSTARETAIPYSRSKLAMTSLLTTR